MKQTDLFIRLTRANKSISVKIQLLLGSFYSLVISSLRFYGSAEDEVIRLIS